MSSWWTKLLAMLRGDHADDRHPDAPSQSLAHPEWGHLAAQIASPSSSSPDDGSRPPSGREQPDLRDVLNRLQEMNAEHIVHLAAQASQAADLAERLMEKAEASFEEVRSLREKLATLPEVTAAAVQSLADLEERLESFDEKGARSADHLARAVREIEDIKARLEQLGQAMAQCQETCAEVAGQQEQTTTALTALRELAEHNAELAKADSATIKSIADERSTRYDELRGHMTERYRQLATRNTVSLLLSAIAAIAAITAAVLIILEHP